MARAMARGWGDPVLCSDGGSGRAAELAAELGGRAATSAEVADESDLVVLCHKPAQVEAVAGEIGGRAKAIASVVGGVSVDALQTLYPGAPVFRLEPNTPVEVRRGIICYARAPGIDAEFAREVMALLERLGTVVAVPEHMLGVASAVTGVGPAYMALVVEAQVDAAVRYGLAPSLAGRLAAETMAGTAALLQARNYDTLAVRRQVTSPGGTTAKGLDALERGGLRTAFQSAIDRVSEAER
jgi:pyrroline-5-carboxylate reductase